MSDVEIRDNVNHPPHYGGKVECIDYIRSVTGEVGIEGFCLGNAIKYIHRYPFEQNLTDLKKAIWYLDYIVRTKED